jgi:hypothetical protein
MNALVGRLKQGRSAHILQVHVTQTDGFRFPLIFRRLADVGGGTGNGGENAVIQRGHQIARTFIRSHHTVGGGTDS